MTMNKGRKPLIERYWPNRMLSKATMNCGITDAPRFEIGDAIKGLGVLSDAIYGLDKIVWRQL